MEYAQYQQCSPISPAQADLSPMFTHDRATGETRTMGALRPMPTHPPQFEPGFHSWTSSQSDYMTPTYNPWTPHLSYSMPPIYYPRAPSNPYTMTPAQAAAMACVASQGYSYPTGLQQPSAPVQTEPINSDKNDSFKKVDGKYECVHCSQTYLNITHMKQHLLRHTGKRSFQCVLCKTAFWHSGNLKKHIQRCTITRTGTGVSGSPGAQKFDHLESSAKVNTMSIKADTSPIIWPSQKFTNIPYGEDCKKPTIVSGENSGIEFSTPIDALIAAIQTKAEPTQQRQEPYVLSVSFSPRDKEGRSGQMIKKRYHCSVQNCNKSFQLQRHLGFHLRIHAKARSFASTRNVNMDPTFRAHTNQYERILKRRVTWLTEALRSSSRGCRPYLNEYLQNRCIKRVLVSYWFGKESKQREHFYSHQNLPFVNGKLKKGSTSSVSSHFGRFSSWHEHGFLPLHGRKQDGCVRSFQHFRLDANLQRDCESSGRPTLLGSFSKRTRTMSNETIILLGLACMLSICKPTHALGDTDESVTCMGPTISWILLASLAFIKFLVLDVLGVEYLSLAMFGFALCWPIVKTDSRSSTTLLYTVYLGSLISTLLYGYAAFMTHNNPRMSLFWAISLATVALLIVLMSTQDGMQVGLAILPIVLSLSVFMVANFVIIRQYIESCVVAARNLLIRSFESCLHATGACFIGLGRRWCRTSTSDEDVERAESEEDEDMELLTPA